MKDFSDGLRGWKHMADLMPANPDSSPLSTPLREVFHLP
jgi:L-rhamnose mutarotase